MSALKENLVRRYDLTKYVQFNSPASTGSTFCVGVKSPLKNVIAVPYPYGEASYVQRLVERNERP
ncbi:hypothetical protein ANSO36C_66020 (plasmid) [Nostoc cf. commune SO-36]|uniref:Uncharacterized protein n=1 Tax=Nostoc cf. commune SO-36 TaxID=449208 RepID=A0ABM7ZBX9_NOSCO|nr:hypothetical protein ANSO36C_66020 [Nostoc cf. commune SO-36]